MIGSMNSEHIKKLNKPCYAFPEFIDFRKNNIFESKNNMYCRNPHRSPVEPSISSVIHLIRYKALCVRGGGVFENFCHKLNWFEEWRRDETRRVRRGCESALKPEIEEIKQLRDCPVPSFGGSGCYTFTLL